MSFENQDGFIPSEGERLRDRCCEFAECLEIIYSTELEVTGLLLSHFTLGLDMSGLCLDLDLDILFGCILIYGCEIQMLLVTDNNYNIPTLSRWIKSKTGSQ